MSLPEGWTDDMTFPLPPGTSLDQLVDFVINALARRTPDRETERRLIEVFGLTADDAALLRERVCGGIVRAAMGPENELSPEKDPAAAMSFARAMDRPEIIRRIYPQFASSRPAPAVRKRWWQFWLE